jgi:hypothetical protein
MKVGSMDKATRKYVLIKIYGESKWINYNSRKQPKTKRPLQPNGDAALTCKVCILM